MCSLTILCSIYDGLTVSEKAQAQIYILDHFQHQGQKMQAHFLVESRNPFILRNAHNFLLLTLN